MNFENVIQRKNKWLLPFSWLYKTGVVIFHKLYDWGIKKTVEPQLPVICIGNLSVGGTGKTPMVEYLLRLLLPQFKVATISRGYKRQSKGIIIADSKTIVSDIGDEPMQFHTKFPKAIVVVGEKRVQAMNELMIDYPATQVVILDDAFQHRAIKAGLNILLTDYHNLYNNDYYLPAGQLRDLKSNAAKADIIIVTKCPDNLSIEERTTIAETITRTSSQQVYFTSIRYGKLYNIFTNECVNLYDIHKVLLLTGIANPLPLEKYVKQQGTDSELFNFPDHHTFTLRDMGKIKQQFELIPTQNKAILTTEKDATRLMAFRSELSALPVVAITIEHQFLFNEGEKFDKAVIEFINAKTIQNEEEK
ncbi:MAG: tetraacyldisaccharide 4'-kinase [Niabella sp.]